MKRQKIINGSVAVWIMLLGFIVQEIHAEPQSAVVDEKTPDQKVQFQTTSDTRFDLSVSHGKDLHFVVSETKTNWTKKGDFTADNAAAYITDCNPRNSTELFSGKIWGKMGKDGPGPGNLIAWSIEGKADFYFIKAESTGSNEALVLDLNSRTGESILSFVKEDKSSEKPEDSTWILSPGTESPVANSNKVTICGQGGADWCPDAGVYNVVGKRSSDQTKTDAIVLKAVEIGIEGPTSTIEGEDSAEFNAKVNPDTLKENATYEWKWKVETENVGNDPNVDFEDDDEDATIINEAHWFASPNSNKREDTGWTCNYTIISEVTIDGKKCKKERSWIVEIPLLSDCGSPAAVDDPHVIGFPTIASREVGKHIEWYVSGKGTLTRRPPYRRTALSLSSQFWKKIYVVHEGRHLEQWETWDKLKVLYDADGLYAKKIQNMKSNKSKADLEAEINNAISIENSKSSDASERYAGEMEADASALSNNEPPDFLE